MEAFLRTRNRPDDGRASRFLRCGSVVHVPVVAAVLGFIVSISGCAFTRVSDLDAYRKIPMNRVIPYPSVEELRKRSFEIIIVDRPSVGISEGRLDKARSQVRRGLERITAEAGASIIDRSLQDLSALRAEGVLSELNGRESEPVTGADYALATRFSTFRYSSTWKQPFRFLWQSAEDVASRPGSCNHRVEIEFDVQVIEIGGNDRIERTFTLEHRVDQNNKDLDSACTITPVSLRVLFETAIDDTLACLRLPLAARLAPRGHVMAHRKAREADRHLYRVSLGSAEGIQAGDVVEIRREQRSTNPSGETSLSERVVSRGRASDQVRPHHAWIAVDPSKAVGEILEGDVVRPIEDEGLLSSLTGPNCGAILVER